LVRAEVLESFHHLAVVPVATLQYQRLLLLVELEVAQHALLLVPILHKQPHLQLQMVELVELAVHQVKAAEVATQQEP
jgi:hypothetical protein